MAHTMKVAPDGFAIADSHVIQGEPLRDRERLIWTLDLRPA